MNSKKIILCIIILATLSSCADRYSTRTRIHPIRVTQEKKDIIIIDSDNFSEKYDNNSPQEIIEILGDTTTAITPDFKTEKMLETAYSYLGTPYKYGGSTASGIDCSGLVGNAFKTIDISLARSASAMSKQGESVALRDVEKGDLLFFTTGRRGRIRHVGIVVEKGEEIKFIHASAQNGVMVSSLEDKYWSRRFRKAKRIL